MKLSGIALLFLSLTNHSSPTFAPIPLKCSQRLSNSAIAFQQLGQLKKSLKLYCYHRCVSWRQAVVYWRWDGANFHWGEDSRVQPLLAVHKQEQTPCVCLHACTHVGEKECACVSICGHTQIWGKSDLLLFSTVIPEVKTTKKCNTPSSLRNCKGEEGKHWQFSCKSYHSMDENNHENIVE